MQLSSLKIQIMKEIKLLILFILLAVTIYSCKDNTVTPVVNPPQPVVLFEKDSVVISSSDSGRVNLGDTLIYQIMDTTINNLNITYTLQSNATSSAGTFYYNVFLKNEGATISLSGGSISQNIDSTFSFDRNILAYRYLKATFILGIYNKTDHSTIYIRFKNIKITKLN